MTLNRLALVAVFLVCICAPASAMVRGGYTTGIVGTPAPFQGNPFVAVTGITPVITCQQSGTLFLPAQLQCDAHNTSAACTGTTIECSGGVLQHAYSHLEVIWTTNDSSADTFTVAGRTVNSNRQFGPEFASLTRSAMTLTVTVTMRGCASGPPLLLYTGGGGSCLSGAFITASTSVNFTVSAGSWNDFYFNTSTGVDTNACTLGSPCATIAKCASVLENGSNFNRCNLDCTQTFSADTAFGGKNGVALTSATSYLHGRVQPGGADCPGADPIITGNSTNVPLAIQQHGTTDNKSDIVVSHVQVTVGSGFNQAYPIFINGNNGTGGSLNNVTLDHVTCALTFDNGSGCANIEKGNSSITTTYAGLMIWGGSYTGPASATTNLTLILGGPQFYYSVIGATVGGGVGTGGLFQHAVYVHAQGHVVGRWLSFAASCTGGGCTPSVKANFKTSYDPANGDGSGSTGQYWLISENDFSNGVGGNCSPGNNNLTTVDSTIDDFICQQNIFEPSLLGGLAPAVAQTLTVRDNWACFASATQTTPFFSMNNTGNTTDDSVIQPLIYRNLLWSNKAPAGVFQTIQTQAQADTYSKAWRIGYNAIENDNSTGVVANINLSNMITSNASVIDWNLYWTPNNAGNQFQTQPSVGGTGTSASFATWKSGGADTNGSTSTNPGFPSPSTCNFGPWPSY